MAVPNGDLPSSALWKVVQQLGPCSLARVACTSRELQDMADASILWQVLCVENFPLRRSLLPTDTDGASVAPFCWKRLYRELRLGCKVAVDLTRAKVACKEEGSLTADAFKLEEAVYNMFYQHGWVFPVAGRSSLTVFFSVSEANSFGYCLRLTHLSSQSASMPGVIGTPSLIQVHLNGQLLLDRHPVPAGDYQRQDWIVDISKIKLNEANTLKILVCQDAEAIYWLQRVELFHAVLASPLSPAISRQSTDISYPDWVAQSTLEA